MTWKDPPERTPEETRIATERQRIRESLAPLAWRDRHIRLNYDLDPAVIGMDPSWGVCGHDLVCIEWRDSWRHPYPHTRVCDQPPTLRHLGVF